MVSRSKLAARKSAIRILCSYGGMESAFSIQQPQVVVGRASCSEAVDLDLAPDLKVSRRHARIWTEGGKYWIEDLNSSWGTQVNGIAIRERADGPSGRATQFLSVIQLCAWKSSSQKPRRRTLAV